MVNTSEFFLPSPIDKWKPEILQKDGKGDFYLPYEEGVILKPENLFRDDRPGWSIVSHSTGQDGVESMEREGILTIARRSIITTTYPGYRNTRYCVSLVAVSPYIYSQEYYLEDPRTTPYNPYRYSSNLDPLVGLTVKEAKEICPQGLKFNRNKHKIERGTILRFIPQQHLIAEIGISSEDDEIEQKIRAVKKDFCQGVIEESAVEGKISQIMSGLPIKMLGRVTKKELFFYLAAAMTESKILSTISSLAYNNYGFYSLRKGVMEQSEREAREVLVNFRPSFPFTRQLVEKACEVVFRKA